MRDRKVIEEALVLAQREKIQPELGEQQKEGIKRGAELGTPVNCGSGPQSNSDLCLPCYPADYVCLDGTPVAKPTISTESLPWIVPDPKYTKIECLDPIELFLGLFSFFKKKDPIIHDFLSSNVWV